jgi:hypothetical protein
MANVVAERVVRHIERAGFVVMKKPPQAGGAALGGDSKAKQPDAAATEGVS